MKLIRMETAGIRYEIAATSGIGLLIGLRSAASGGYHWEDALLLLPLLLWMCRGIYRLTGQSISGEDCMLTQMLPVPRDRLMAAKAVVCGLWTAGLAAETVIIWLAVSRLDLFNGDPGLIPMTLWLMARGMSAVETALAVGLLPGVFYLFGWFTGGVVLNAHIRWGGGFERRRCGPLLTVLAVAGSVCVICAVFLGADRLTALCPWSFGCYGAALVLTAGCGLWLQRCCGNDGGNDGGKRIGN